MSISKTAFYYQPKKKDDEAIKNYLKQLARQHHRWGFDKMLLKAKADGKKWNHKRLYRVYCEMGLNIRVKPRKRIPKGEAKILMQPIQPNICWSMDFMSDTLICGKRFRTFNVIDDYNRECLMIHPGFSLTSTKVTRLLDEIAVTRGYPQVIRVDNGPEFTSATFINWAKQHNVFIHHIQPGKPAQNGFIERFNRIFREDILDSYLFHFLQEVSDLTIEWIKQYNHERPHESLAGFSPINFGQWRENLLIKKLENSTLHQS